MNQDRPRTITIIPYRSHWGMNAGVILLAMLLLGVSLHRAWDFYHDDAYITLRYAARALAGQGLTFSDGERVEGYSHPLWLLQLMLLGKVGIDLEIASRALGFIYLVGVIALCVREGFLLPLLLWVTIPGVALWTVGGLETLSFCFFLLLGCTMLQRPIGAGLALAAAALTRPEGLAMGLCCGAVLAARTQRLRPVLLFLSGCILPPCGYLIFRLLYFGEVLPNSVQAKVTGLPLSAQIISGLSYLRATYHEWTYGALTAIALVWLLKAAGRMAAPLCCAGLLGVMAIGSGGDNMIGARLFIPVATLLCFAAMGGRPTNRVQWGAALVLVALVAPFQVRFCMRVAERNWTAALGAPVGRYLNEYLGAGALLAAGSAGATAYYAPQLRFLDTAGLTDTHIARRRISDYKTRWQRLPGHHKGDGAYVLSRAPDVVIIGPTAGSLGEDPKAWLLGDFELLTAPAFHKQYGPCRFLVPVSQEDLRHVGVRRLLTQGREGIWLTAYLRRDSIAAARLAAQGECGRGIIAARTVP